MPAQQKSEYVYIRRIPNKEGLTLKAWSWQMFKQDRKHSSFFDDLVVARKQLLHAAEWLELKFDFNSHGFPSWMSYTHPMLDPAPARESALTLRKEADLIPEVWLCFRHKTWTPSPTLSRMYDYAQLHYEPLFMEGECDEVEDYPWMTLRERERDKVEKHFQKSLKDPNYEPSAEAKQAAVEMMKSIKGEE